MLLLGLSLFSYAQENDSLLVPIDSVAFDVPVVDSIEVIFSGNDVQNATAIRTFFEKLYQYFLWWLQISIGSVCLLTTSGAIQ